MHERGCVPVTLCLQNQAHGPMGYTLLTPELDDHLLGSLEKMVGTVSKLETGVGTTLNDLDSPFQPDILGKGIPTN